MAVAKKIQVYDTTLRDGCQSEDVSLTVEDKLEIAERLDDLGIDYIEGGWPGSNERDAAFFSEVKKLKPAPREDRGLRLDPARQRARLGRSQPGAAAARRDSGRDRGRQDLGHARARGAQDFRSGKSRNPARHDRVLKEPRRRGHLRRRAFLRRLLPNPEFALACLHAVGFRWRRSDCALRHQRRPPAARNRGRRASRDRGGAMPARNPLPQRLAKSRSPTRSPPCAAARCRSRARSTASASAAATPTWSRSFPTFNSSSATSACRPASSRRCARSRCWSTSWRTSRRIARQAYVGRSAFAHKAGLHVSGIQRNVHTYEHIDPATGRQRSPRAALGALRARQHPLQEQGVRPRHRAEQREDRRAARRAQAARSRWATPSTAPTPRSSC